MHFLWIVAKEKKSGDVQRSDDVFFDLTCILYTF